VTGTTQDPYSALYAHRVQGMSVSEIRALFAVASRPEIVSLAGGSPAVSALPLEEIAELLARLVRDRGGEALQYGPGQGSPEAREAICQVMEAESLGASPEDVIVTTGSQHALALLAQAFLDPGDIVIAEGPSYVGALGIFAAAEAEVIHVEMDSEGLDPTALAETLADLERSGRRAKFLYTVPNFHNPAGVTLTEERRDRLVALAQRHDLLIIEDNPYGLLGFDAEPGLPLCSRDAERVIYLGSFSKIFAAGIRLGWVLAPPAVRRRLVLINEAQILCPSMLTQLMISEYITHYPWRDQVKAFRELYRARRDALLRALELHAPDGLSWTRPAGGFYSWVTLPEGLDAKVLQPRALAHKVAYVPGIGFYADGQGQRNLRLSYCLPEPSRIEEGVQRLSSALREEIELRSLFTPSSL
jgi:DNA-binding transcriptional MocR family regulator